MSIKGKDVETFAIGVALYYVLLFICMFYPAFILGLFVLQSAGSGNEFAGLFAFAIGYCVITGLLFYRQYVIVLFLYIITLWPFIHQVITYLNNVDSNECFPLPLIDWCPFW